MPQNDPAEIDTDASPDQLQEVEDYLKNACGLMAGMAANIENGPKLIALGGEGEDGFGIIIAVVGDDGRAVWELIQNHFDDGTVEEATDNPFADDGDPED